MRHRRIGLAVEFDCQCLETGRDLFDAAIRHHADQSRGVMWIEVIVIEVHEGAILTAMAGYPECRVTAPIGAPLPEALPLTIATSERNPNVGSLRYCRGQPEVTRAPPSKGDAVLDGIIIWARMSVSGTDLE